MENFLPSTVLFPYRKYYIASKAHAVNFAIPPTELIRVILKDVIARILTLANEAPVEAWKVLEH